MQQRGLTPPIIMNPIPTTTPSQMPTLTLIPEIKNHELVTAVHTTRRRREEEPTRETPIKTRSHVVRSLIEEMLM